MYLHKPLGLDNDGTKAVGQKLEQFSVSITISELILTGLAISWRHPALLMVTYDILNVKRHLTGAKTQVMHGIQPLPC